jgi:hypothetical protein
MKKEYAISIEIQSELIDRANIFSEKHLKNGHSFIPDARGKFIYVRLLRPDEFVESLGRLTYTGDKEKMAFAIFLYSSEKYSFDFFPGNEYLDGTLEGALKAIMKAYDL